MKNCCIDGCDRKYLAKGFCGFHYKRALFGRPLLDPLRPQILLHKHHPVYLAWCNMKTRCDNPNAAQYKYYGGRGITYTPEWKEFIGFYTDMFPSWQLGLELDRRDTNGNYNRDNCRWITHREQCNNRNERGYLDQRTQD